MYSFLCEKWWHVLRKADILLYVWILHTLPKGGGGGGASLKDIHENDYDAVNIHLLWTDLYERYCFYIYLPVYDVSVQGLSIRITD